MKKKMVKLAGVPLQMVNLPFKINFHYILVILIFTIIIIIPHLFKKNTIYHLVFQMKPSAVVRNIPIFTMPVKLVLKSNYQIKKINNIFYFFFTVTKFMFIHIYK